MLWVELKKMNKYHEPVMLNESIDALNVTHNGIYVDATFVVEVIQKKY